MQLTERRSEGLLRVYDVVVPASELEQKLKAKIAEVQPRVRINGFRPGKVPVAHIRKVYGAGMMQDIINETVQTSTREGLDKANARPASEPTLDLKSDIAKVTAGEADLAFELSVEVMPDFEPADMKAIAITRPIAPVADEQVEESLTELAKANTTYEEKTGAAKEGDEVTLDFVGKIDGEAFDGGAMNDAKVVIGAKQFIPGFEEELVGVKAGDEKVLDVTFPADYGAKNLAGKAAQFETTIKKVSAPKEGAPDDAWAQALGLDSLQGVKDLLRQRLESNHTQQSRMKAKRALFDKLDELHSFDLPPRMLEAEFQQIWRQVDADRVAGRLDDTDKDKSEEELRTEYHKIAERRVRLGLLLAEIGRRHKIEVNDQEVAQEIAKIARGYPGQERQIFEMYQKNPQLVATARAPLYEDKVVNYILELIKVTDQTVTKDELFADDDPEVAAVAKDEGKRPKKSKAKAEAKSED